MRPHRKAVLAIASDGGGGSRARRRPRQPLLSLCAVVMTVVVGWMLSTMATPAQHRKQSSVLATTSGSHAVQPTACALERLQQAVSRRLRKQENSREMSRETSMRRLNETSRLDSMFWARSTTPSLAMTTRARIKCFNQHELHQSRFGEGSWCIDCGMPLCGVNGWCCSKFGAQFVCRVVRRSSFGASATAETARLAKCCRLVCCDDCSTKLELLDVILHVPYVDGDGVTRTQPATTAVIDVRVRVRATHRKHSPHSCSL